MMVEGGETVIWEFLRNNLVDELMVFIAPMVIGGKSSPTLAGGNGAASLEKTIKLKLQNLKRMDNGILARFTPCTQD